MKMSNFTNSALATVTMLSTFRSAPRNQTISKITPHHVAGNLTVEAVGRIFQTPGRNASSNYGIGSDGRVAMYVEERNRAWTSSSAWNDNQSVTFEVSNNALAPTWSISDRAYETMINLMVDICQRNPGIKQKDGRSGIYYDGTQWASLTRHNMFSATSCPGAFIQARMDEICRLVNARLHSREERFPLTPENVHALVELGVIGSPDYWLSRDDIRFLDNLIRNALATGQMRRDVHLGITCLDTALDVLVRADVMNSPNVWRETATNGPSQWLPNLIINMANRFAIGCGCAA